MRRTLPVKRALSIGVFLATQVVYLWTLNPTFPNDDSAETITAGATLGLQHPPGYALAALVGRFGSWVPLGNDSLRANWIASLWASLGAVLLTLILLEILPSLFPKAKKGPWAFAFCAGVGGVLLAFSPTYWQNALGAKGGVYHLGLCLALATLLLLAKGGPKDRTYALSGCVLFIVGLGSANHWETMILFLPAILWVLAVHSHPGPTNWIRAAALSILGLSPLLYLPLRSRCEPVLNIGSPDNLHYFWADLSRGYYSYRESGLWESGDHFLSLAAEIFHVQGSLLVHHMMSEFQVWSLLLAALGLFAWARGRERRPLVFITVASITLIAALFSFLPAPGSLERPLTSSKFLLPLYAMVVLCISVGLAYALHRAEGMRKGFSRFLAAGATLLLLYATVERWNGVDQSRQLLPYDYGVDLLKSLPKDSLFFAEADEDYFSLYYLREVEHRRPDVTVLPTFLLFEPWGTAQVEKRYVNLGLTASSMTFPDPFARVIYATSEIVVKGRDKRPIGFSRFDGAFHRFYLARYPAVKARSSGIVALLEKPLVQAFHGPSLAQLRTRDLQDAEPSLSGIRQVYALSIDGK